MPFASVAGSEEARARWPLGTAGERRGAPGERPRPEERGAAVGARRAAAPPPPTPAASPPEDGSSSRRLARRGTVGLPTVAADPAEGCLCRNEPGARSAAAKVGEGRIRRFIISSLLLPSPLGGVRGGNNRHQVLGSLFSVCL